MIKCDTSIFALFLCSIGPPSRALVAYHHGDRRMPLHDAVIQYVKEAITDIMAQLIRFLVNGLRSEFRMIVLGYLN